MSAQRKIRAPAAGTHNQPSDQAAQKSTRSGQRSQQSDSDWAETQGETGGQPANRIGSPTADACGTNRSNTIPHTNDQGGSRRNQRQDPEHPEHPERPADGGQAEMRGPRASSEPPQSPPESFDQPESADRGRHPERRREES